MTNTDLTRSVDEAIDAMDKGMAEIDRLRKENVALQKALLPFALGYVLHSDPIGDSDLDADQPRSVPVTLGACRTAARLLQIHKTADGGIIVR